MKLIQTTYQGKERICREEEITPVPDNGAERGVINVYPDVSYQTIYGFGGAVTEAAGYVYSKLSQEEKEKFIKAYYSPEGLNYRFGRCSIDSCDFGLGHYSAKTAPEDEFSLARDGKYVLPLLKDIYESKKIQLFMSPWSPPVYMKTNGQRNGGGKLKQEYYGEWADYICTYLQAYRDLGLNVYAVCTQNEPKATQRWDSCVYTAEEEGDFLANYLYPAMKRNQLTDVRRIAWDHNRERAYERLQTIYNLAEDKTAISGVGYHWYSGDHFEALRLIYEQYPDLLSVFTEGCVEYSHYEKTDVVVHAVRYAHEIIGCLNNGCQIFLDWNILLDETGGPNHQNNLCSAPIMQNEEGGITRNPSYYAISHFSRYLEEGAKRVAVTTFSREVEATAWRNVDGGIVTVVLNASKQDETVHLRINGKTITFTAYAESITTLL